MSASSVQCSQCTGVNTGHIHLADDVSAHDMSHPRFSIVSRETQCLRMLASRAELRRRTSMSESQSPILAHQEAGSARFQRQLKYEKLSSCFRLESEIGHKHQHPDSGSASTLPARFAFRTSSSHSHILPIER